MQNKTLLTSLFFVMIFALSSRLIAQENEAVSNTLQLVVLGTVQDAGSPHIACKKECCLDLFDSSDATRKVVSLGLIDSQNQETFLFEATPDITEQVKVLKQAASWEDREIPNGIFLTHAHIGHYAGSDVFGQRGHKCTRRSGLSPCRK